MQVASVLARLKSVKRGSRFRVGGTPMNTINPRELKAVAAAQAAMASAPMPESSGQQGVSMAARKAHAVAYSVAAAIVVAAIKEMGVTSMADISRVLNAAAVPTAGGKGMWAQPEVHRVLTMAREDNRAVQQALVAYQVATELIRHAINETVGLFPDEAADAINARGITTVTGKPWNAWRVEGWRRRLKIRTNCKRERAVVRANQLAPIIAEIQASGITSHNGIAAALNARGIPSATGKGRWYNHTVGRLLARLKPAPPALADALPRRPAAIWLAPGRGTTNGRD
jgi:hypothetical protein